MEIVFVDNDLIGIDRTIEPNNENSSIVGQFWNQHEQQMGQPTTHSCCSD